MKPLQRLGPAILAGVAALVLVALVGYKLTLERTTAVNNARAQTSNLAGVLEEHARLSLHRVRNHLVQADETLQKMRVDGITDTQVIHQQLVSLLPADHLIHAFLVLGKDGEILSSSLPSPETLVPAGRADRDYFSPHIRGADRDLVFGAPEKNPADGKWMLPVSRRITLPGSGAWDGVLVAMVQPGYFQAFYNSIDRGKSGFVSLFMTSGLVAVTSPQDDAVMGRNLSDAPLFTRHLPNWPTGTVREVMAIDNVDRIYSYRVLNDDPVMVSYGLAATEVFAPWRESALRDMLLLLLALLSLGTGAIALMRHDRRRQIAELTLVESQERYRELVESSPIGIAVHREGKIVFANPAAVALLGAGTVRDLVGRSAMSFVHPDDHLSVVGLVDAAATAGHNGSLAEERFVRLDGTVIDVEVQNTSIQFEGAPAVRVSLRDITERKRAELRQQHQQTVLQMLTNKMPLVSILETIVRDVEAAHPALLCSIMLLEPDGQHLRHVAAPSLPDFYVGALDGVAIAPVVDPSCASVFSSERVIVQDLEESPFWEPYCEVTRRVGLASCWSQPILSGQGRLLGIFVIYQRHAGPPAAADLLRIEEESLLTALVIEKTSDQIGLQRAASVFTYAREGIAITDTRGIIIDVNDTFSQITGYSREEAVGKNRNMLDSGLQGPEFYVDMWRDLAKVGHWSGEFWNRRKNGDVYAEMLTISVVCDSEGQAENYVALSSDITAMKEQQRQLEHMAHYDALTGLPNRVLLADRLKQAMLQNQRRKQSLAVAYLDLDGFKKVNDKYGHPVGDELLIALAQRMKASMRDGDTLARFGGDEFVAVMVDLDPATDGDRMLQRLLKAAADPIVAADKVLQVSASIGVTYSPQDDSDADLLIRHADHAMYAAKHAGKNRYVLFDIVNDAAIQTRRESLERVHAAFQNGEFVLYYQPEVNMVTGKVIGAEALIRWQHPTQGLLPPGAFLPLIEDHPISIAVGEWVIATALTQMKRWRTQGLDLLVSVNIGAHQLQQDGFATRLGELLAEQADQMPHRLQLEVLETSALADIGKVGMTMKTCQSLGVSFALDDFGTGYSSLTYLKQLPAELLKIDRSFVFGMLDDPGDMAIVNGVIGLAKAFQRQVIAEGVETAAHGQLLQSIGCELAQGFGIAMPMPADALPEWVDKWQAEPVWRM